MKHIIPFRQMSIPLSCDVDRVRDVLKEKVDTVKRSYRSVSSDAAKPFFGTVGENSFRITRTAVPACASLTSFPFHPMAFGQLIVDDYGLISPLFVGEFSSSASGTELILSCNITFWNAVFAMIGLVIIGASALSPFWPVAILYSPLYAFQLRWCYREFNREAHSGIAYLCDLFGGSEMSLKEKYLYKEKN